ncbi:hypothetical protein INR49_001967 [Caranx melampygus]|nr:hypothetical protein INR49_001967 [Caranx melampygus]
MADLAGRKVRRACGLTWQRSGDWREKTEDRRVKEKEGWGNTCQNGLMPALVRPTLPAVQTSLGMKQFLPFPLETASAVSLFPGFNTVSLLLTFLLLSGAASTSLRCLEMEMLILYF